MCRPRYGCEYFIILSNHRSPCGQVGAHTLARLPTIAWDFKPTEDSLWAIEGVCSKWRNILLNSPRLRSNIEIFLTSSNFGVNANNYVRKLGRQMDRSGNHPLTITIFYPKVYKHLPASAQSLLNSLCCFIRSQAESSIFGSTSLQGSFNLSHLATFSSIIAYPFSSSPLTETGSPGAQTPLRFAQACAISHVSIS